MHSPEPTITITQAAHQLPPPRRRLKRRKLDIVRTIDRFRERISELSNDALKSYLPEGCWLSTYDVWGCYETDQPNIHSNAFEILKIARDRGLFVNGVVTEHKTQGRLVSTPAVEGERIFVGRHNTFNGKVMHRTLSIQPRDKVYLNEENDS
jgi:hypothetical protein